MYAPLSPSRRLPWPAVLALALVAATPCAAQYPDKPIRLLLPFPAGGTVDLVARLATAQMAEELGRPFVIENRAGAGGMIATDATAKAAPDGYTLLLTTPNHTINAALNPKVPYDSERDLVPVSILAEIPELLVSHPAAPFQTFEGFVDYARKNPGKLNYASAGNGTLPHLTMELLLRRTGIEVAHIPYRGAAPAMTDLLAGQVQLKMDTYATAAQLIADGKLWMGLMAPARVPPPIIERLAAAAQRAVRAPALAERLKREGVEPVGGTPQMFGARIVKEIDEWRNLAQAARISFE
jgi:tripartite-type tricarboxylate transporter receptor subunit TctC